MALGISERLLERAYAPIDLSYAYKKIELFSRQVAAEEAAAKKEAAKQYYADLAAMNKERTGVRAIDIPEVTQLYNEWSNTERQLANNPNLINKNPELYGQLKNKSDEVYGKLNTMIKGSKELGKVEVEDFAQMADPKNMDYYMDGAPTLYKQNVMNKPWSQVVATGANDRTKYFEQKIDGRAFYKDLDSKIGSQATGEHRIKDTSFKGAPGEVRDIEFKKMPDIGIIHGIVYNNLSSTMGKKASKFATQQVEDVVGSGDYDAVKNAYNNFFRDDNPNGYKKYFDTPQPKIPLFEGELTPTQKFINYTTAKEFLSKLPQGVSSKVYFETPSAEARFKESIKKSEKDEADKDAVGFIDAYSNIVNYLSQPKARGGASLDRFNSNAQKVVLNEARDVTGISKLSNRDVYVKLDSQTGDISVISMREISEGEGQNKRILYKKGQPVGKISGEDANILASKVLGVSGTRTAKKVGVSAPTVTTPAAPTNKQTGKQQIPGF